jgi:hypothetical protein
LSNNTFGSLSSPFDNHDRENHDFSIADVRKVQPAEGGGNPATGEATTDQRDAAGGYVAAATLGAFVTTDERSDKHELLLNNCSGKRRRDGRPFATNATASDTEEGPSAIEISAPMSQGFAFMRQKRAFLPDMQFQFINYTINPDFAKDCFFTQLLPVKNPLYREGDTV